MQIKASGNPRSVEVSLQQQLCFSLFWQGWIVSGIWTLYSFLFRLSNQILPFTTDSIDLSHFFCLAFESFVKLKQPSARVYRLKYSVPIEFWIRVVVFVIIWNIEIVVKQIDVLFPFDFRIIHINTFALHWESLKKRRKR